MFREMRRKKQQLSIEQVEKILKQNTSGVLAVFGDDGYPYAVPLSYVYTNSKIYFHGAKEGHKLDSIKNNEKVSFCVIDKDEIVPEKYTTYFRSIIAFGRARIIENIDEKRFAIEKIAEKYSPDDKSGREKEIDSQFCRVCLIELNIDYVTGKEAIELVRKRSEN